MTSIKLFSIQKIINLILGFIGIFGVLMTLSSKIFELNVGFSAAAIFPVLLLNFYQYVVLKKQFFQISNESVEWKFPTMDNERKIIFKNENPTFSVNWKGIVFQDGTEIHEISLDGLWKKDRLKIQISLKNYFSLINST